MQVFSASHVLPVAVPEQLYCGVIDGKLTVGVADNSPLFEEATEKGGYFFRQYPLVDNGVLVEKGAGHAT